MDHVAKILIVEDQYFVAIDNEMTLHSAGFDCVGLATNAEGAFALAREKHPDLIIMDIRLMGRADGVNIATAIYRELGIRSIFASGHADTYIRQQAQDAQPLGWLNKPYSGEQLIKAVQVALIRLEQRDGSSSTHASNGPDLH